MDGKEHRDLIDFPVSDIWRDHYYEQGLTTYPSPAYRSELVATIDGLRGELKRLNDLVEKRRRLAVKRQPQPTGRQSKRTQGQPWQPVR